MHALFYLGRQNNNLSRLIEEVYSLINTETYIIDNRDTMSAPKE